MRRADRAIPGNVLLATPQGPADLELTLGHVHVLRDDEFVVHTNHCLHPELVPINREFPELIESVPRHQRIEQLLGPEQLVSMAQVQAAPARPRPAPVLHLPPRQRPSADRLLGERVLSGD